VEAICGDKIIERVFAWAYKGKDKKYSWPLEVSSRTFAYINEAWEQYSHRFLPGQLKHEIA